MMRGDEDNENDNYDENSSRRKGGQWIMQTPTQVARLKRLVISKCKGQIRVAGFESTEKKKKKTHSQAPLHMRHERLHRKQRIRANGYRAKD